MKTISKEITKSTKLLTGEKITRTGTLTLAVPETASEVVSLLGENMAAFAALGYRQFVKQRALNQLVGAPDYSALSEKERKELKSLNRNFRAALDVMVETLGQTAGEATEILFSKKQFAGLKADLEAVKTADAAPKSFDFSVTFPIPSLGETEDEGEGENEGEND
jgi:hypothetical protein